MSQRKTTRQSSEEVMAAREAMEKNYGEVHVSGGYTTKEEAFPLPENVTPISPLPPITDDDLPDFQEEYPIPAPEAPITDEEVQNFLSQQGQEETEQGPDADLIASLQLSGYDKLKEAYEAEAAKEPTPAATAENQATTEENRPSGVQVECPCCGTMMFAEVDGPKTEAEYAAIAVKFCSCSGAKVLRQESEMNDKIEAHFGPASKARFGTEHSSDEIMIMKLLASYVAKRKIKAITITLNDNDKAVFLIKKDATIVRHTRAIKAESEV